MYRRTMIIFRVLALLTTLVALGGLFFVSLTVPGFFTDRSNLDSDLPYFSYVYLGLLLANFTFVALLLISAYLLWRLHRRGLFLLVLTLCLELVYVIGLVGSNMILDSDSLAMPIARLTGVGMMALGLQIYTAYPLFALVLLILAYRHLGIPARAPGKDPQEYARGVPDSSG